MNFGEAKLFDCFVASSTCNLVTSHLSQCQGKHYSLECTFTPCRGNNQHSEQLPICGRRQGEAVPSVWQHWNVTLARMGLNCGVSNLIACLVHSQFSRVYSERVLQYSRTTGTQCTGFVKS